MKSGSVVVDESDIFCTSISPDEADTPLRVHSDAVLAAPVTDQSLQAVPRRDPEILDLLCRMDHFQLPQRRTLHGPIDTFDVLLMPDALGVFDCRTI